MKRVLSLVLALIIALCTGIAITAAAYAAPVLPTVGLTTVKGCDFATTEGFSDFDTTGYDTDYLVGAVLTVVGTGNGYDDYLVDCLLNLSVSCKVKLLGKYSGRCGNFPWQGMNDYTQLPSGQFAVMAESLISMTVAEVDDEVGTFYCAFALDSSSIQSSLDISLDVVIYEEPTGSNAPVYIDPMYDTGSEPLYETLSRVAPTAKVTMVNGTDFDMTDGFTDFPMDGYNPEYVVGAVFELVDTGMSYDNYIAEFLLDISEDCNAALLGQYGEYAWQGTNSGGTYTHLGSGRYGIMAEALLDVRVRELESNVGTFYCAFAVDSTSFTGDLGVDLKLVMYAEPVGEAAPAYKACKLTNDSVAVSTVFTSALPSASVTTFAGDAFAADADFSLLDTALYEARNAFGAVVTADSVGEGYASWLPALNISASSNVSCTVYTYAEGAWSSLGSYSLTSENTKLEIPGTVSGMTSYRLAVVITRDTLTEDTAIRLSAVICNPVAGSTEQRAISSTATKGFRLREIERKVSLDVTPAAIEARALEGTVSVVVKDTAGEVIDNTATLGTGMIIEYTDGNGDTTETVAVVMGDADGTPGINQYDLDTVLNISVSRDNDSTGEIAPLANIASDVNGDGYVDALDAMFIELYLSGLDGYNDVTYDAIIVNK